MKLSSLTLTHLASTLTHLASRFTHLASRFTHLASRFTHLASTFTHLASRFTHLASRFTHLASTLTHLASTFTHLASRFTHLASTLTPLASSRFTHLDFAACAGQRQRAGASFGFVCKFLPYGLIISVGLGFCNPSFANRQDQQPSRVQYIEGVHPDKLTRADKIAIAFKASRQHRSLFVSKASLERDLRKKIPATRADFNLLTSEVPELSLATRFLVIQQAKKTIDMAYYIFKEDIVGEALLYELCRALKRGVDVRVLVDAIGSIKIFRRGLRSLYFCKPGFIKDSKGNDTQIRAGYQIVIFNPVPGIPKKIISGFQKVWNQSLGRVVNQQAVPIRSWWNRRMHEKIIITDGESKDGSGMVITGGRNISRKYYNLDRKGRSSVDAYQDLDIIIKDISDLNSQLESSQLNLLFANDVDEIDATNKSDYIEQAQGVVLKNVIVEKEKSYGHIGYEPNNNAYGELPKEELIQMSQLHLEHFNKLFDHLGNTKISKWASIAPRSKLKKLKKMYEKLFANEKFSNTMDALKDVGIETFSSDSVEFVHEIHNLFSRNVTRKWKSNDLKNPNSIDKKFKQAFFESKKRVIIVSPYMFFRKTTDLPNRLGKISEKDLVDADKQGTPFEKVNEYADIQIWLAKNPDASLELIVGSVLTSDNFLTQAVIDKEIIPNLHTYQEADVYNQLGQKILSKEDWSKIVSSGRVKVWEFGLGDTTELDGDTFYGKIHAKFVIFDDDKSLVTSSNLDYRSRDYNSESGVYIIGKDVNQALFEEAELLKSKSLLWGSPEWKVTQEKIRKKMNVTGFLARKQAFIYKVITKLPWLYWIL